VSIDLLYAAAVASANQPGAPWCDLRTEWWRVSGGMGHDGSAPAVDCQPFSNPAHHKCRLRPTGARVFFWAAARVTSAAHARSPEREARPPEK
jgi:hypothetical protein